jgi:hypothetical protein
LAVGGKRTCSNGIRKWNVSDVNTNSEETINQILAGKMHNSTYFDQAVQLKLGVFIDGTVGPSIMRTRSLQAAHLGF